MFILANYFASKSFAAVREAFSNAYLEKEAPNKTRILMSHVSFAYTSIVAVVGSF